MHSHFSFYHLMFGEVYMIWCIYVYYADFLSLICCKSVLVQRTCLSNTIVSFLFGYIYFLYPFGFHGILGCLNQVEEKPLPDLARKCLNTMVDLILKNNLKNTLQSLGEFTPTFCSLHVPPSHV